MAKITTVHVMRHGEVHNPDRILYGRLDGFRLSDRGGRQAEAVANFLADRDIVHVVASPLERAQQTATPVAARHGLDVNCDPDLIESANVFEGLRVSPGDGALRDPRNWWHMRNVFKPSWGEPYREVADRMTTAVGRARANAVGHEAVCVSHQLPIWTLRMAMEGRRLWHDPRKRQCELASLTSLDFDGEKLVGVRYTEPAEC